MNVCILFLLLCVFSSVIPYTRLNTPQTRHELDKFSVTLAAAGSGGGGGGGGGGEVGVVVVVAVVVVAAVSVNVALQLAASSGSVSQPPQSSPTSIFAFLLLRSVALKSSSSLLSAQSTNDHSLLFNDLSIRSRTSF